MMLPSKYSHYSFDNVYNDPEKRLSGFEFNEYLSNIITKYELTKYLISNRKAINITYDENTVNVITKSTENNDKIFEYSGNYVAVCTGKFNGPKTDINTTDENGNIVIHSKYIPQYKYENLFAYRNVTVIGNGNTGCDIASLAVKYDAKNVTLYYKTPKLHFDNNKILLYNII